MLHAPHFRRSNLHSTYNPTASPEDCCANTSPKPSLCSWVLGDARGLWLPAVFNERNLNAATSLEWHIAPDDTARSAIPTAQLPTLFPRFSNRAARQRPENWSISILQHQKLNRKENEDKASHVAVFQLVGFCCSSQGLLFARPRKESTAAPPAHSALSSVQVFQSKEG